LTALKPLLNRGYFFWLGIVIVYSSVQIFRGVEPLLSWLGLCLTALPLMVFFVAYFKNPGLVTRGKSMLYTLVSGLGLVICMAVSYRYDDAAGIVHIWAGLTFVGWVLFVRTNLED
jgi:hypothetical protein